MSIVLVIIGLIVGGFLVGRDLIESAKIRAQLKQIDEFKIAVNTFKMKFNSLPGDMPPSQATQLGFFTFIGAQAGKGGAIFGTAFGNNDGIINRYQEVLPFWSHLSDSKMTKGNYGGVAGNLINTDAATFGSWGGSPLTSPYTNDMLAKLYPRSMVSSSDIVVELYGNQFQAPSYSLFMYANTNKLNMFVFTSLLSNTSMVTSYQAYQMDSKIDDGFPTSGNIRDINTSDLSGGIVESAPCTTSGVSPIQYNVLPDTTNDSRVCAPSFLF